MKRIRSIIITLCVLAFGVSEGLAQQNILGVSDVTVGAGREGMLSLTLDNSVDVVAVQFTLSLPEGVEADVNNAVTTARSEGHTVKMNMPDSRHVMGMVFSAENSVFRGRSGEILRIPLRLSSGLEDGTAHALTLGGVVVARDGSDVMTGTRDGMLRVASRPDFTVSSVRMAGFSWIPGEIVGVSWQVGNDGDLATEGGYIQRVYVMDSSGTENLIATLRRDEVIPPSGIVAEQAEIKLPLALHADGECRVVVKLTPYSDSGEPSSLDGNNSAVSESTVQIAKMLRITPETSGTDEADAETLRFTVTRSGSVARDETFEIEADADSRFDISPMPVVIYAGESEAIINVKVTPNGEIDDSDTARIAVRGNGYPEAEAAISIADDITPALYVDTDCDRVAEGGGLKLTVTAQRAPREDLRVCMATDRGSDLRLPESVVIRAGDTTAEIAVDVADDDVMDSNREAEITASADGYISGYTYVVVEDNDIPDITLSLTPGSVAENSGASSVLVKVRRSGPNDKSLRIRLSDDSDGAVSSGSRELTIPAGVDETVTYLGPRDNSVVDGDRKYRISAAVVLESCSCTAAEGNRRGYAEAILEVVDNDGPSVTLTSSRSSLSEGESTELTVARNTSVDNDLPVLIECDREGVSLPGQVVIPSAQREARFTVEIPANSTEGDDYILGITASAEGHSRSLLSLAVTDNTLPDAVISDIGAGGTGKFTPGMETWLTATVTNGGTAPLPSRLPVSFVVSGETVSTFMVYTVSELKPGQSEEVKARFTFPARMEHLTLYAAVNEDHSVGELSYANNATPEIGLSMESPLKAVTVTSDKAVYQIGDNVVFTGSVTSESKVGEVEIYVTNEGHRETLPAAVDANGNFRCEYTVTAGRDGHFSYGACWPGQDMDAERGVFDVPGLRRLSPSSYARIQTRTGDAENVTVVLRNPAGIPLTGVKARLEGLPDNIVSDISCPDAIGSGNSGEVVVNLKGTSPTRGNDWVRMQLVVESDEGVSISTPIYFYCQSQRGELVADVSAVSTTMPIQTGREYTINIGNVGRGETGRISLDMPDWIRPVTPREMPSLEPGGNAEVVVRFVPDDRMTLNSIVRSSIVFNCENGSYARVYVEVEPVSEKTGKLTLDACDNLTYYTEEAPHLEGASVTIEHPVTGEVIASGLTGTDGIFGKELNEGRYRVKVTAPDHESYDRLLTVDPGRERKVTVNLKFMEVAMDYKVVEDHDHPDEYVIKNVMKYEARVPEPYVRISGPDRIDGESFGVGDSRIINLVLTNVGQIAALNTSLSLPADDNEWHWEKIDGDIPASMAPGQSVGVTLRLTRMGKVRLRGIIAKDPPLPPMAEACLASIAASYEFWCGTDLKENVSRFHMAYKLCVFSDIMTGLMGSLGGTGGGGTGLPGGGGGNGGSVEEPGPPVFDPFEHMHPGTTEIGRPLPERPIWCEPCVNDMAKRILEYQFDQYFSGVAGEAGGEAFGLYTDVSDVYAECKRTEHPYPDNLAELGMALDEAHEDDDLLEQLDAEVLLIIRDLVSDCLDRAFANSRVPLSPGGRPYAGAGDDTVDDAGDETGTDARGKRVHAAETFHEEIAGNRSLLSGYFGADVSYWLRCDRGEVRTLLEEIARSGDGRIPDKKGLSRFRPSGISEVEFGRFIDSLDNTVSGKDDPNSIDMDEMGEIAKRMLEINNEAVAEGYASVGDRYRSMMESLKQGLEDLRSNSVCASVTLSFTNKMYLTRQAFRGILHIHNGHQENPIEDMRLSLSVRDADGVPAGKDKFDFSLESLDGFSGEEALGSGWSLPADSHGYATVIYLPSKLAAPEKPLEYDFGGRISYVDPFSGINVTRQLTETTLTVNPSPNLDLAYFIQRDVISDDPLTEEIEPTEETEFSLLVHNKGFGDAGNVVVTAESPKIIDNDKGLDVDFELKSASLNGVETSMAMAGATATRIGEVKAGESAIVQWNIEGSKLGHFVEYDVEATRVSGNQDPSFSLLDKVETFELIRSIDTGEGDGQYRIAFLTNDISDSEDLPDMLHLADGDIVPVGRSSVRISENDGESCVMTVTHDKAGWHYGYVSDPCYGQSRLMSAVRLSDGAEISTRNFWVTDRTLLDGRDPIYENRIHIADKAVSAGTESYRLTFESRAALDLDVAVVEGIPLTGTVADSQPESVTVVFNKKIDPSTFTCEDMKLRVEGEEISLEGASLTTDDSKRFVVDLSKVSCIMPDGYTTLTVQTAGIKDAEGFRGRTGRLFSWVAYSPGGVMLDVSVYPEGTGAVFRDGLVSGGLLAADYGAEVVLEAKSAEGYRFSGWTVDGRTVEADDILSHTALGDAVISAVFMPNAYALKIAGGIEGGFISGATDCSLYFGDRITLTAIPYADHEFKEWLVNGQPAGSSGQLVLTIAGDTSVEAVFGKTCDKASVMVYTGWNWLSHPYVDDALIEGEPLIEEGGSSLGGINPMECVKVRSNGPRMVTLRGHLWQNGNAGLSVLKGWNRIGFPVSDALSIHDVIVAPENGDVIVGQFGFAVFDGGVWHGSLDVVEPFAGYMYYSCSDRTVSLDLASPPVESDAPVYPDCNPRKYPDVMPVTAAVVVDGFGCDGGTHKVYAMYGNECCGESVSDGSRLYVNVYGHDEETVAFFIEDVSTGRLSMALQTLTFGERSVGTYSDPFVISNVQSSISSAGDGSDGLVVCRPDGIIVCRDAAIDDIRRLQPGIYVVSGKKYVVR